MSVSLTLISNVKILFIQWTFTMALQELLGLLYDFNRKSENWAIRDYTSGTRKKDDKAVNQWGLGRARRAVTLAYNLAFTCLLRFDEVLKIQSHDILLLPDGRLKVTLSFRKTSQFGGAVCLKRSHLTSLLTYYQLEIKPFILHLFPKELAHLCPVHAYSDWISVTSIDQGYIFRKLLSGDRISANNVPMVGVFP